MLVTFTLASLPATGFALRIGLFGLSVLLGLLARVALALLLRLHGVLELKLSLLKNRWYRKYSVANDLTSE